MAPAVTGWPTRSGWLAGCCHHAARSKYPSSSSPICAGAGGGSEAPPCLVACSGEGKGGSLTVLRRSVVPDVITEVPLPGGRQRCAQQHVWSVRPAGDVRSFQWTTSVHHTSPCIAAATIAALHILLLTAQACWAPGLSTTGQIAVAAAAGAAAAQHMRGRRATMPTCCCPSPGPPRFWPPGRSCGRSPSCECQGALGGWAGGGHWVFCLCR